MEGIRHLSRRQWVGVTVAGVATALGYSFWFPTNSPRSIEPSPTPGPDLRDISARSIGMSFVTIPAGTFEMGSPTTEVSRDSDETLHRVTITTPFAMSIHEVTQGQFQQVLKRNPSTFKSESGQDASRIPVEGVTWFDAIEFCNALSQKAGLSPCYELNSSQRDSGQQIKSANVTWLDSGKGYRLPTEAEWEYACRAGTTTPFHFGSQSNGKDANDNGYHPYGATTKGPCLISPTTVGSYEQNAFGLHDMHGNVWEWCWDWYDEGYYEQSPGQDPKGPASGDYRVLRGGSSLDHCRLSRSAGRYRLTPDGRHAVGVHGFRVVCVSAPRT